MNEVTTTAAKPAASVAKSLSGRRAPPATITIFGAGGDLTKRLVVPALYHLARASKLSDEFAVIGVDHNDMTTEAWRASLTEMMGTIAQAVGHEGQSGAIDQQAWSWLIQRMQYMRGDFLQSDTFDQLGKLLADQRKHQNGTANVLFYLAVGD